MNEKLDVAGFFEDEIAIRVCRGCSRLLEAGENLFCAECALRFGVDT